MFETAPSTNSIVSMTWWMKISEKSNSPPCPCPPPPPPTALLSSSLPIVP